MAEFSSTQNTGNLIKYIEGIPDRGVPSKITGEHIESLGLKSKNDRTIPAVLKFIGLIDSSGIPNENYKQMRNKAELKKILAQLVRNAYSDLFLLYPAANGQDFQKLKDFFATKTDVGEASLKNIVGTFQALCAAADFSGGHVELLDNKNNSDLKANQTQHGGHGQGGQHKSFPKTEVHFDIQIHLPGDQKPEVYESIFKNLGKYVLGNKDE